MQQVQLSPFTLLADSQQLEKESFISLNLICFSDRQLTRAVWCGIYRSEIYLYRCIQGLVSCKSPPSSLLSKVHQTHLSSLLLTPLPPPYTLPTLFTLVLSPSLSPSETRRNIDQVEQGSKNHEVVPSPLIAQLSGARSGGVNKALGELAKKKLVGKVQNIKCLFSLFPPLSSFAIQKLMWESLLRGIDEGYRLTYGGYDFLACRTFAKRDTIYSVGNQIGTGKESGTLQLLFRLLLVLVARNWSVVGRFGRTDIYVVADDDGAQMVMKIHR